MVAFQCSFKRPQVEKYSRYLEKLFVSCLQTFYTFILKGEFFRFIFFKVVFRAEYRLECVQLVPIETLPLCKICRKAGITHFFPSTQNIGIWNLQFFSVLPSNFRKVVFLENCQFYCGYQVLLQKTLIWKVCCEEAGISHSICLIFSNELFKFVINRKFFAGVFWRLFFREAIGWQCPFTA